MRDKLVYLETHILQQDMRVRMPKSILENLNVEKGKTRLAIYLDKDNNEIVIRVADEMPKENIR